ncbi:MAG: DUF4190 domain-containing protein [Pirellulales bacterium]|jgi:hypothetical protein
MQLETDAIDDQEGLEPYRALSRSAVASLILGGLSFLALLHWAMGLVPVTGVLLGLVGYGQVRRNAEELTGRGFAAAGLSLSVLFLFGGWARLGYLYVAEVPEGYRRISYADLQQDPAFPGQEIPPAAMELEGQRVFIKGYVYPGPQQTGIKQFVLCRDNGTCCFGGALPKLNDMVLVTLVDPLRLEYSTRLHRLAGTFHARRSQAVDNLGGVLYQLDADYVQ